MASSVAVVSVVLGAKVKQTLQIISFLLPVLTITPHAHGQALLQPAVLASIAVVLVHITILIQATPVAMILAHGPFKEAFAALTADHAIVPPRCPVPAHNTRLTTKQMGRRSNNFHCNS